MADLGTEPASRRAPPPPRWVKAFALGALLVAVVVIVVMLVVGGEHGPGRHSTGATPSVPPAAGTAAPSGAGGPGNASEAARRIAVTTLDSMIFEPGAVDVAVGETVTFVVTNPGRAVHEFTIGDAAMQQQHADAMRHMPSGVHHEVPNSITLQPGETKPLTWRFGAAGSLEYGCHEPGHFEGGMRGRVTVD